MYKAEMISEQIQDYNNDVFKNLKIYRSHVPFLQNRKILRIRRFRIKENLSGVVADPNWTFLIRFKPKTLPIVLTRRRGFRFFLNGIFTSRLRLIIVALSSWLSIIVLLILVLVVRLVILNILKLTVAWIVLIMLGVWLVIVMGRLLIDTSVILLVVIIIVLLVIAMPLLLCWPLASNHRYQCQKIQ